MTYIFSQLAQDAWAEMGKIQPLHQFLATGGSTSTAVNAKIADREIQPDDNYVIDGTLIVVRDAGGAGSAPEGEMQRISAYSGANQTYTVDTNFTVAIAAGDTIAIADSDMTLQEMLRAANRALKELGPVEQKNTSLTTIANQTEYTLPALITQRDIISISYQTNLVSGDNQFSEIHDYEIIPGVAGAPGILVLPSYLPSGRTVVVTYRGEHAPLTAYNSPVYFYPSLAIAATVAHMLQWYNGISSGGTDYWVQRENRAWVELDRQRNLHPISGTNTHPKVLIYSSSKRGGG